MDAAELFRSSLALIDRVAHALCRRVGMSHADAEDFASSAKVALMEDDYRILRAFEGRSSLHTYLTVILQRLLSEERMRVVGRWHPSRAAERHGPAAVLLETMLHRDGRSFDDAFVLVQSLDPALTPARAREIAATFPQRPARPQLVAVDDIDDVVASPESADHRTTAAEQQRVVQLTNEIVRETIESLPLEERVLIRFHFGNEMTIADISRMLRVPQRPLYRRLEASLRKVRESLERAGIDSRDLGELIGSATTEMDFGLAAGKNGPPPQTNIEETR